MPNAFRLVALGSALFFGLIFLSVIRKRTLQPFHTVLWGLISVGALGIGVIFAGPVKRLATWLGLTDASFLVLVAAFYFVMVYILHMSASLSATMDRTQELISKVAMLDMQLREKGEAKSPPEDS